MITIISLFFGAFLAATILPFSSEIMLLTALKAGDVSAIVLIMVATLGNVLGALVNWALGRYFIHFSTWRYFPFNPAQIDRASQRFKQYGLWTLLLSWVPIIGDPLTLVAGALSVRLLPFLILVTTGKAARYAFLGMFG